MLTNGVTSRYGHAHKRETPSGEHIRPLSSLLSVLTRTCLCTSCVPACTCACVYVSVLSVYSTRYVSACCRQEQRKRTTRQRDKDLLRHAKNARRFVAWWCIFSVRVQNRLYTRGYTHTRARLYTHRQRFAGRYSLQVRRAESLRFIMQMSFITAGETQARERACIFLRERSCCCSVG